jgi:hypothetical protein
MENTAPTPTRLQQIRNWNLSANVNPELRVYSGTKFGTQRISGIIEYTGSFQGWGATPPLFAGNLFTFLGYTAPTSGVPCSAGCAVNMQAVVSEVIINWTWTADERRAFWTINFFNVAAATQNATFPDPCDLTLFCDTNLCGLCPTFKDCFGAAFEFCNIHAAQLTFNANLIEYSNCTTNCIRVRTPGNLDWSLDIMDHNACTIPIINDDYEIILPASTTTNWVLKWGKYTNISNWNVDIETGEIIGKTNRFDMQAVNCCVPATPVLGSILDPGAVQVWPAP